MWGNTVRGRRVCEIHVRLPMNDGAMETVEYIWVDIWCTLDWIIGLCRMTAEIHFIGKSCSTSEYTKWDAAVADGNEVCENSNPLQGLKLEDLTWWNEDLCTQSRTENGFLWDCERMKILSLMLAVTRNRTGVSAVGAWRYNHYATNHCCVGNYCYVLYTYLGWEP